MEATIKEQATAISKLCIYKLEQFRMHGILAVKDRVSELLLAREDIQGNPSTAAARNCEKMKILVLFSFKICHYHHHNQHHLSLSSSTAKSMLKAVYGIWDCVAIDDVAMFVGDLEKNYLTWIPGWDLVSLSRLWYNFKEDWRTCRILFSKKGGPVDPQLWMSTFSSGWARTSCPTTKFLVYKFFQSSGGFLSTLICTLRAAIGRFTSQRNSAPSWRVWRMSLLQHVSRCSCTWVYVILRKGWHKNLMDHQAEWALCLSHTEVYLPKCITL